ncbi:MAG TPA: hypothetical protein VIK91_04990 [Nannocystis sp.]
MASAARKKATTGSQPKAWRGPIKIQAVRRITGTTYGLDGDSRRAIEANFPDVHRVPAVFISAGTDEDFERVHSKMWKQIALVLTGLPSSKLKELGVVLYDPFTKRDLERVF